MSVRKKPKPEPDDKPGDLEGSGEPIDLVAKWRVRQLVRGGFTDEDAMRLSLRPDLDYREAVRLLEDGCPADLILNILGQ